MIKTVYEEMIQGFIDKRNELIEEVKDFQMGDLNDENPNISKKERIRIQNALHKSKILGGNLKTNSISDGLFELGSVLDSCGFDLQMVNGDSVREEKGRILLSFKRKTDNRFIEGIEIENSQISFSWENLELSYDGGIKTKKRYEFIAYLT
jgi:hypothetical protein